MTSADADHALRVITARCPELTKAELMAIASALAGDTAPIPADILVRIEDVIDAMEARLEALEEAG